MRRLVPLVIRPWMLPVIVAALVVPIVGGFVLAGPPLGLAAGALAVAVLLVVAARTQYDEPIEVPASPDARYRVLVVSTEPLDDPGLVARIATIAGEGREVLGGAEEPQVRMLAPARASLLDRWASDVGKAREAAARVLAVSLASLAAAGLDASGPGRRPRPRAGDHRRARDLPGARGGGGRRPGLGERRSRRSAGGSTARSGCSSRRP